MNAGTTSRLHWRWVAAGGLALVLVAFGICEALGWPFLAAPMQRWIGNALDRKVSLSADPAQPPQATIHLLGGLRIAAAHIEIGAPAWADAPQMLVAKDARLTLGYTDLWRASRGERLRIRRLSATRLDGHLERLADGRASWQFGRASRTPDVDATPNVPLFGRLQLDAGTMTYRDALLNVELDSTFSLVDASRVPLVEGVESAASAPPAGLQFNAKGSYRKQPLRIDAHTAGVLPLVADDAATFALPVVLDARIGGASVSFRGTATDAVHLGALQGRYTVQGPSLAAIGDPLRVTLPTTGPFRAEGLIAKDGVVWKTVVERASIGASRLAGAFTFDPRPRVPLLAGRLTGSKLLLADLGPAVGAPVPRAALAAAGVASAASAPARANAKPGRVLPDREFDLPSLRAMDANVLIAIDTVDLGSTILEPLKPLRTHLVLADGVLTLRDLDARTGQGRLAGTVRLDGRQAQALWDADLRWDGVRLESWIHQARADASAPPYATGRLNGQARVAGQGRSTAAILGSLRGGVRMQLVNGTISHLAVEAAGLDIAQGLGVLIKGDDALKVECAVADLVAEQGALRPRVLVLDTADSTLWVDGAVSLATESMDLRVLVTPRDFSPMALRTPLRLHGSFANPDVSLDKGKLGMRVGAAALLSLLNPLAALIPFVDTGDSADAKRATDACRAVTQRAKAKPLLAAPPLAKPRR